jgi:hypothetical protein
MTTTAKSKHGQTCCCIAAVGVVLGTLAQPAAAAPIGACQIIRQPGSYKLVDNLSAVNGTCLKVTGSDITIDLNGFTISGNANGAAAAIADANTVQTQRAITVRNGYIIGGGVVLGSTDGAVVEDMDISGAGITLLRGRVERNHVHDDGAGGGIEGFEATTAIDNIVLNTRFNGLVAGPGSQIEGNLVGQNGNGILNSGNASGTVSVGNSILRDNVAFRNTGVDFSVVCRAILQRNVSASPAPKILKSGACIGSPNQPSFQSGNTIGSIKGEHP